MILDLIIIVLLFYIAFRLLEFESYMQGLSQAVQQVLFSNDPFNGESPVDLAKRKK